MNFFTRRTRFALIVTLASASLAAAVTKPEVSQQIGGFTRPSAAAFSPDKSHLYVLNHAQGEYGTLRDESFISKLKVDSDGVATADQMRFLANITAPIDLDFSPVRLGNVPSGAIFVVAGTPLVQDDAGRSLKDLSRIFIGLLVVDPRTGRIIESVDMGPNSKFRLQGESSLLAPTSICFDDSGNLYIGESGIGGHMFPQRQGGRPGLWRLPSSAVAELLSGEEPTDVEFIRTTSLPGDMCFRPSDDKLYFVTNHSAGPPSGSVFLISSSEYEGIGSMQTLVRGIEALSSVQITPSGRVLLIGNGGELMFPKGNKNTRPLRFRPKVQFSTPGKLALATLKDGTILVAVPEASSDAGLGQGQRVSLVKLPSDH